MSKAHTFWVPVTTILIIVMNRFSNSVLWFCTVSNSLLLWFHLVGIADGSLPYFSIQKLWFFVDFEKKKVPDLYRDR